MSLAPISEARTALKLAARSCLSTTRSRLKFPGVEGPALVESIHRFVRTIDGNVHLARVAHDGEQLYAFEISQIADQKVKHWKALRTIRRDLEARFPVLTAVAANTIPDNPGRPFDYFDTLVARLLAAPSHVEEGNSDDPNDGSVEPADLLWTIVLEVLPKLAPTATESALADVRKAISDARDALSALRSATFLLGGVHPSAKLLWLREIVDGTIPSVGSVEWYLDEAKVGVKHLYRKLFFDPGHLQTDELSWVEQFQVQIAAAVNAVEADFQARLGERASIAWLVRRYAERCRRLRARELQALVDGVTRNNERNLTRSMATYLFDQGLDVLIELQLGESRYDVFAPALLVEAKVCSARKSALRAIVEGLQQIASYKIQLRSERATVDAVLVLFCLGGRSPDVPADHTIGSLKIAIVVVDVAPPSERGHRAAPSIVVTREQIAAELERLAQKGQSKRGRRRR